MSPSLSNANVNPPPPPRPEPTEGPVMAIAESGVPATIDPAHVAAHYNDLDRFYREFWANTSITASSTENECPQRTPPAGSSRSWRGCQYPPRFLRLRRRLRVRRHLPSPRPRLPGPRHRAHDLVRPAHLRPLRRSPFAQPSLPPGRLAPQRPGSRILRRRHRRRKLRAHAQPPRLLPPVLACAPPRWSPRHLRLAPS